MTTNLTPIENKFAVIGRVCDCDDQVMHFNTISADDAVEQARQLLKSSDEYSDGEDIYIDFVLDSKLNCCGQYF